MLHVHGALRVCLLLLVLADPVHLLLLLLLQFGSCLKIKEKKELSWSYGAVGG